MLRDVDEALAEIGAIRSQLAAATVFKGFGPAALATTGGLAFLTTLAQVIFQPDGAHQPELFFGAWIVTAILSALVIWVEMQGRSRRHHSDLAHVMIQNAIGQFLPFGAAGAALLLVFWKFVPDGLWLMPPLWALLVGLGIFGSARSFPRAITIAAAWYFLAGLATLMLTSAARDLSPWAMGVPFGIGQLLVAAIIHFSTGKADGEI